MTLSCFLLSAIVQTFVFAAITFSTVTVQVQAVVGQLDTIFFSNFVLTLFDRVVAKFDHFAAV